MHPASIYCPMFHDIPAVALFNSMAGFIAVVASIGIIISVDRVLCRRQQQQSPVSPTHPSPSSFSDIEWLLNHYHQLEQKLAEKERQYKELKLVAAASHAKYLQLERHFLSNEEDYERKCSGLEAENARLRCELKCKDKELRWQPFAFFTERLVLQNRVWQQEKHLGRVQEALVSSQKSLRANAFAAFRDRLLLVNAGWKQQAGMKHLEEEIEKMKQGRVKAITRAAKQMVLDTRKEGLIEELVKDMIEEVQEGKRKMTEMKQSYEKEIQEMNGEWFKDYRGLVQEIEKLRLGHQARMIEQEITNEMEGRLLAELNGCRKEVKKLEASKP